MSWFKKDKPPVDRQEATPTKQGIPNPIEILSGNLFETYIGRGHIPPPGPAFLNRFLNALPDGWSDAWSGVEAEMLADREKQYESISLLCTEVLDRIGEGGAPIPVIQAAEDAVTLNMTALAVHLARSVLRQSPTVGAGLGQDSYPGWDDDWVTSNLALQIRDCASGTDMAVFAVGGDWFRTRPGDCVRVLVDVMGLWAEMISVEGQDVLNMSAEEFSAAKMMTAMSQARKRVPTT